MRLIISYYKDKSENRQKEIDQCLLTNKNCKHITEIVCLIDSDIDLPYGIKAARIDQRPTFNTMLSYSGANKWNIIANADIFFDDTLSNVYKYTENDFLALTRYEIINGSPRFFEKPDSQDSWIYYGIPKKIDADFTQGILGCDNSLCYKALEAGYNVINPSLSIKTYHLHSSNQREYFHKQAAAKPYHVVWPTE